MSGGFDRIKPPERRLLERGSPVPGERPAGDAAGRAVLFSAGDPGAGARATLGMALHCSRCDATTALDRRVALRAAFPLFLVLPWRSHPVFALCPACRHRAWLRPRPAGGP